MRKIINIEPWIFLQNKFNNFVSIFNMLTNKTNTGLVDLDLFLRNWTLKTTFTPLLFVASLYLLCLSDIRSLLSQAILVWSLKQVSKFEEAQKCISGLFCAV